MTSRRRLIDGRPADATCQDGVAADTGAGDAATAATAIDPAIHDLMVRVPRSVTGSALRLSMPRATGRRGP
ncbi:hypothetical protein Aoc01nite_51680 [Actinoplanes octamycinicus]|nr:hypothetical protein Aoc01nite_51680 [Actinoplanes octamycinicus]